MDNKTTYVTNQSAQATQAACPERSEGNNFSFIHIEGNLREVNDYYPYGLLCSSATINTVGNYKFQNKEFNKKEFANSWGLDWYNHGARMYDPELGRWHVQDPALQFSNPYLAMGNDPINNIDPDGTTKIKMIQNPIGSGGDDQDNMFSQNGFVDWGTSDPYSGYSNGGYGFPSHLSDNYSGNSYGGNNYGGSSYDGNFLEALNALAVSLPSNSTTNFTTYEVSDWYTNGNYQDTQYKFTTSDGNSLSVWGNTEYGAQGNGGDGDNWLSNAGTAIGMTAMWATGTRLPFGAGSHYSNDAVSGAMRNATGIVQARNDYYKSGKTSGDPGFGLKGLFNAGIDPIEQFIGSYHYQIDAIGNNLQFTITNQTSFGSAAYHLWPYSWNWSSGPMGNFNQTYIFTEPIRK